MILIVAPFTFPPTHLSYQIARRFMKWLLESGWSFTSLDGVMANKTPFLHVLKTKPSVDLIIYMGHGAPECLCGDNPICNMFCTVDVSKYKKLVEDKIVIAAPCCFSARELGKAMIENGARCYMGSVEAMYAQFNDEDHTFMQDWIDMFLTLYKHTVLENTGRGYDMYLNKCQHYINLYKAHLYEWTNADWNIMAVKRNMEYFRILGDKEAKVVKEEVEVEDVWTRLRYILLGLFSSFSLTAAAIIAPIAIEYGMKAYEKYKEQRRK